MTNAQLLLAISIPSLLVLFGILMNRQDATAIRAEVKAEINSLRAEIRADINALRGEIVAMRNNIHADMIGIHERTTKLEAKVGG